MYKFVVINKHMSRKGHFLMCKTHSLFIYKFNDAYETYAANAAATSAATDVATDDETDACSLICSRTC
jgi:hypothetical protein